MFFLGGSRGLTLEVIAVSPEREGGFVSFGRGPRMRRSLSAMRMSLMLASRRRISPLGANSQSSLPYDRHQSPWTSRDSYWKRTAIRSGPNVQRSLRRAYSSSRAHFRSRNASISARPVMNSSRLRQTESTVYAAATRAGSRVFQAASAASTF